MRPAPPRRGLAAAALATSVAAWLPLAALAVAGALPAGRRSSGSGLLEGPAWPFVAVVFTVPLTLLLGLVAFGLAWRARSRRPAVVAGAAIATMVVTIALLTALTSDLNMR